jgi:hypothetical protein
LTVRDSATSPETKTSTPPFATVTVGTALAHPATPTVSATKLDADQPLTVKGTIPTTGTALYSWTWLVSLNGSAFSTATECATDHGSAASGGSPVTCTIAANTLAVTGHYKFALKVTDGATAPETQQSSGSVTVTVHSALTASSTPSVSSTHIAVNQVLTVRSKLATTGSAPFTWQWMVSVNGGTFGDATMCTANSGSGGAGATATCTVPANTLTVGDTYAFALEVTDSATAAETATSGSSSTVSVGP